MAQTAARLNVLFTSVGRRVELMHAFRRAYERLGLAGAIVAVDIDPLAPALQFVDRPYLVPRLDDADYLPVLSSICEREAVDLIFPLIDPDIPVLARGRAALEAGGARVVVVGETAVALTADKWLTHAFFRRLDLPAPRSWLPDGLPDKPDFPLFIKPRGGSAAKDTFRVRDRAELDFFIRYVPEPIIQEYLPGPEITNDVICDLDGTLLGVASRQRLEVRWGEVAKGVTVYDSRIVEGCARLSQALPARGPITVQCMMKDGRPHFTEINARMGGGLPLGIRAGVDAPLWLLARAAGLPCAVPPLGEYELGLTLSRFDDAVYLTGEAVAEMDGRLLPPPGRAA